MIPLWMKTPLSSSSWIVRWLKRLSALIQASAITTGFDSRLLHRAHLTLILTKSSCLTDPIAPQKFLHCMKWKTSLPPAPWSAVFLRLVKVVVRQTSIGVYFLLQLFWRTFYQSTLSIELYRFSIIKITKTGPLCFTVPNHNPDHLLLIKVVTDHPVKISRRHLR